MNCRPPLKNGQTDRDRSINLFDPINNTIGKKSYTIYALLTIQKQNAVQYLCSKLLSINICILYKQNTSAI